MKLNLGACDRKLPGFLSVDIVGPADQIVDLAKRRIRIEPDGSFEITYDPWPWADSSVDEIAAYDILEHFPGDDARVHAFNQIWRVLKPGAIATIEVPSATEGAGAWQDPTHRQPYTMNTFLYFADKSPELKRFRRAYGILGQFRIVSITSSEYKHTYEKVTKITAVLAAVKP